MCAPTLGNERQNAVTQQNRQQNDHADGGADKDQLMEGISTAQHFDHGVHNRDAEHREQQIKNSFKVQGGLLFSDYLVWRQDAGTLSDRGTAGDTTLDADRHAYT